MSGLAEGIYEWSVEEMLVWLRKENLHDCVKPFSLKKIDGRSFLNLSDVDIKSLCISQESKRKLVKALQMAKGKKKALIKRFGNGVETRERRKPPSFTLDDEDDSDSNDGWATDDFDDSDDESEETWGVGLEDEDIQQENKLPQESPKKEVPNIPSGLVAQLRKGLAGSFNRNSLFGYMPPQHNQNQAVDPDDIYDEPPAGEDDLYEEPSDDSGSGIVIRNTSHQMATRSLSETGGYIDEWRSKNNASDVQVPCPPRPPKPGRQPPPPVMEDSTQEFYEVPESDPLGPQMDEQYEIPGNEEPGQETYEIPGNDEPEVYEEPEEGQQTELYEIPEQEEQIETYEVPDQSPAPPMRIQAKSLEPPGKPISAKPSLPFKPFNKPPPGNKPAAPPNKPKIKERPPMPPLPKSDIPGPKRLPSAPSVPTRVERNTNEVLSPTSPVKNQASDRRPVPTPVDDTPPPPPRPGSKHGSSSLQSISSRIEKLPPKPPRLSDSDQPEDDQVIPRLDKLLGAKRPLPSKPTEPKFSGDRMKEAPWFQSSLPRTVAESSLKSFRKDGTFIVRNSSNDPNNFSMSLYYNGHVRHLRIPRVGDKFVLGDSGKKEFNTLMELVDYYSQNNVELKTGGFTCLTVPCPIRK